MTNERLQELRELKLSKLIYLLEEREARRIEECSTATEIVLLHSLPEWFPSLKDAEKEVLTLIEEQAKSLKSAQAALEFYSDPENVQYDEEYEITEEGFIPLGTTARSWLQKHGGKGEREE